MSYFYATVLCIFAYLIASLSGAIIITKMKGLPDPREGGSKNPGATNVLRLAGKQEALMVFVFDLLKGVLPVLLGSFLALNFTKLAFIGLFAVFGHVFPLYYQFKGGKGVATFLGVVFGLHFMFGVCAAAIWLGILWLSSYSSLSSIVMVTITPFLSATMLGGHHAFLPLLLMAMLIIYRHKDNIQRLLDGSESKTQFGPRSK